MTIDLRDGVPAGLRDAVLNVVDASSYGSLQEAIDAADDGSMVLLPPDTTYTITSQVTWSGKSLTIWAYGATLVEGAALTVPLLNVTGDGSAVYGLTIEGIETSADYPDAVSNRIGVRFDYVTNGLCRDVRVSGKTIGVNLRYCERTTVQDVSVQGYAGDPEVWGFNYHNAVLINGGTQNVVSGATGHQIGSVVLHGNQPTGTIVQNIVGRKIHDNCVYISSGLRCQVSNVLSIDCMGTAAKMRGSGHVVNQVTAINNVTAVAVSPDVQTVDESGYSGGRTSITNCVAQDCEWGVYIDEYVDYGVYPRGCTVANNTFTNCGSGGIQAYGGYHTIVGNTIYTADGYGIILIDTPGGLGTDNVVAFNTIDNITSASSDGIRADGQTRLTIIGNKGTRMQAARWFIEVRTSDLVTVVGNSVESGTVLRASDVYSSTNVLEYGNTGTVSVGPVARLAPQVWLPNGAASSPSLRFASDLDSGLYRVAENDVAIATGGSANTRFRYTELGVRQVGFLGATPVARQEVTGSTDGNAALASLLAALANLGLITNSTT